MTWRLLTIEIHDVSPAHRAEIDTIYRALVRAGTAPTTLLVVPGYLDARGHNWDLRDHPGLVDWLQRQEKHGAEIVLHGLTHRAPGLPPPGFGNAFMHNFFAQGLAEFAHLDRAEADRRLAAGRRILSDCGLSSQGFIAPAWQQSQESLRSVAEAGFRFTAFLNKVVALQNGRGRVFAPVLTFDAPHPLIDYPKRAVMRCLEIASRSAPLVRVALHPADVRGARPLRHIIKRIRALLRERRPVTYAEYLA
jgi:predicted deacetylase